MGGVPGVIGGKSHERFEDVYQLGKELGHGSFSTVREGVHKVRVLSVEYMKLCGLSVTSGQFFIFVVPLDSMRLFPKPGAGSTRISLGFQQLNTFPTQC